MNQFKMLLRKDWRLNRVPFYGLAAMVVVGYLIVIAAFLFNVYYDKGHSVSRRGNFISIFVFEFLPAGAVIGMSLTMLVAGAFGGTAFAQERREGWGDFLANMPVSRWNVIFSKLIVGFACIVVLFSVNVAIAWLACLYSPRTEAFSDLLQIAAHLGFAAMSIFGTAWLLSTFLKSDAISACAALAVNVAAAGIVALVFLNSKGDTVSLVIIALDGTLAVATIVAGSVYYARRIAP
jgi:ABC-type transport system involved in multi-copper enzyme maturation permease subunit